MGSEIEFVKDDFKQNLRGRKFLEFSLCELLFNKISLLNAAKKRISLFEKLGHSSWFFAHFSLISSIDSNEVLLSNKYLRVLQKSHFSSHSEMSNITFQQFFFFVSSCKNPDTFWKKLRENNFNFYCFWIPKIRERDGGIFKVRNDDKYDDEWVPKSEN